LVETIVEISGVKRTVRGFLYCPAFVYYDKPSIKSIIKKHDELKDKVKELLESKYDVTCKEEEGINLVSGRADLLCRGNQRDIIVEVKSYRPSKLKLDDLLQLALYFYGYKNSPEYTSNKDLDIYLVYKGFNNEPVFIKIESELKAELEELAKTVLNSYSVKTVNVNQPRIPSFLCNFCANNCPFKFSS